MKRDYPETIFLAEAFTRPKVMYRLAKLGFTQSYTYFTWRNTKQELTEYFTELTQIGRARVLPAEPVAQHARYPARVSAVRRAAGVHRAAGAGGDAGRQLRHLRPGLRTVREPGAAQPGSEEYLNSEKYELRQWDIDNPWSLRELIARVNQARRENPALQSDWSLRFHDDRQREADVLQQSDARIFPT